MKSMIITLAISLISVLAVAAPAKAKPKDNNTIIIMAIQSPQFKSPLIRAGFYDSSFDYSDRNGLTPKNKNICFIGDVNEVCNLIRATEKNMNREYRQGAHDNMKIVSCDITDSETVETFYILSDDYEEDIKVERTIKSCMQ